MKYLILAFIIMFPVLAKAEMDPALKGKTAENFIIKLGNDAISSLQKTNGDNIARRAEFKRLLTKNFDMSSIARFSMGRYWTIATEAEKKRYTQLFRDMVINVYSQRFAEYKDQKFEVINSKPAGRRDFIVNTLIKGNGQPIKVDWRVRNGKVIDVIVEGVSMSVTQRNDFASIIQRNGGQVASLIAHLEEQ